MTTSPNTPQQNVQQSFEAFYQKWLSSQENLLERLLTVSAMPDSAAEVERRSRLIEEVMCHYRQYLEEKSKVASVDVFLLFSPTWLSAYEGALLWIGDYKPSLILRLVDGAVEGLTAEQRERVERMREETKRAEREVSEAMASVQESMASPRVVGLVRVLDGEITELESAIEGLKRALVRVWKRADELRASTVRKVVGILSPPQTVQFLAATMLFQMRVRKWGLQRDEVDGGPSS
ncbi:protein DOG1-like 4 [Abrus precatorius]|uniref:Protein DOG1-like 4 n=1 Tax=Abrus precatorius TaxID=3816 RepID=A0A8B8LJL5_ABRPR|nr:protein DOG1-like 4 [Abrus precatorius]